MSRNDVFEFKVMDTATQDKDHQDWIDLLSVGSSHVDRDDAAALYPHSHWALDLLDWAFFILELDRLDDYLG